MEIEFAAMELIRTVQSDGCTLDTEIQVGEGDFRVFEVKVAFEIRDRTSRIGIGGLA